MVRKLRGLYGLADGLRVGVGDLALGVSAPELTGKFAPPDTLGSSAIRVNEAVALSPR
jgi:hypothetical protein